VSDDRLQRLEDKVDAVSTSVTKLTTTLELFFDPQTGQFKEVKDKVKDHDDFVKKATWTFRIAAFVGASGVLAALKQKFGLGGN
jgi:hypothetical protein